MWSVGWRSRSSDRKDLQSSPNGAETSTQIVLQHHQTWAVTDRGNGTTSFVLTNRYRCFHPLQRLYDMTEGEILRADVHKKLQQNLENFLSVELALAMMLCGMSETHHSHELRAELRLDIEDIIETVRHLARRVENQSVRRATDNHVKDLEQRVGKMHYIW